ncbi:MAG: CocE/NonD family hydrolase [Acidobacteriota bacterium]
MKRALWWRGTAVVVLLCIGHPALGESTGSDEEWAVSPALPVVQRTSVLPNSPVLIKSLGDAAEYVLRWKLPGDAEDWIERRPEVDRAFRKAIGLEEPPERTPLNARVTARHDFGDYLIENVLFESRPGFPVSANLYRPKDQKKGKRPAVLCPIGHYLSAGKAATDVQARCIQLVRMGFVVLVYDAIGQGERMVAGNIHHEAGYALLPLGETIAGWMVWDSMRGIDYLLTLDDVDPDRIGVTGNSGGGLNTLFTAALDDRVRAATVVGFTFEFNNWLKYAGTHCTCTHLPGLFRAMEWFEVAGLIAPRALMMLQGSHDSIFPVSGARRSARNTAVLYSLVGQSQRVRFVELPGQPHAYSRPFREPMYGWMAKHLLEQGSGEPIAEGHIQPLDEGDPRLRCDPDGSIISRSPSVVDLARKKALAAVVKLPAARSNEVDQALDTWVRELTAPPESAPHYLAPAGGRATPVAGGSLEKFSFVSEDGQWIPGLLWAPEHRSAEKVILIVSALGKRAVAESGLVRPLLDAGLVVAAVDLRGRGETLGQIKPGWDINFRLVANQVLFGQPLAGRRAFDLMRTLDYLSQRQDLASAEFTVVGLGEDSLPTLLAAVSDSRIRRIALAASLHSLISQMRVMKAYSKSEMPIHWNDAQLNGRLNTGAEEVDFGSVIPSALQRADVPDMVARLAPRRVLFCQARDSRAPGWESLVARFRKVVESGSQWIQYDPDRPLDGILLLEWLRKPDPR